MIKVNAESCRGRDREPAGQKKYRHGSGRPPGCVSGR